MRIFDKDKKNELVLENLDLTKGYLKEDKLFIKHHDEILEQKEIKEVYTIAEYENGGKDIGYKTIQPYIAPQEAWDEYEDIQVYIEYTEKELEKKLEELKLLKIKEIKDKTAEVILAKYSITTQNNIRELRINTATKNKYTQNDKDEMLDWIDKIRLQGIEFQENVNKINTIDEYNVYSYEFKI
jgi:hypothetical protein